MNALLLLDDGWTAERVAEALFIDAETVRAHRRLYATGGRAGVERLAYVGHAPVLSEPQVAELSAEFSARVYLTAKAVCGFVAARFGLAYTPHAMARLLGRIGFVLKRPKVVPAKADADAQRAFLENTLLRLMAAAEADPATPLPFVDATHPAHDAYPALGWIRRGERAVLPSIPANILVFATGGPTRQIAYWEQPLPQGRRKYTKTQPMLDTDLDDAIAWYRAGFDVPIGRGVTGSDVGRRVDDRQVSVKSLAALVPGFLRGLFRIDQGQPEPTSAWQGRWSERSVAASPIIAKEPGLLHAAQSSLRDAPATGCHAAIHTIT